MFHHFVEMVSVNGDHDVNVIRSVHVALVPFLMCERIGVLSGAVIDIAMLICR
jgi:hypothetical protein